MKNKEAQARIKIDKLLEEAGWRLLDTNKGQANVQVEANVRMDALGDDFENAPNKRGIVDYLLLDDRKFPIAVLEAKREGINPLGAKEQARNYAKQENCRFVILSNGIAHYFWDINNDDPQVITQFPTQKSLIERKNYEPNAQKLTSEKVDTHYLESTKQLRDYQVKAIQAIQRAAQEGKTRYLLEMATGTGKTTVAGAVCKLFLKTGNTRRILFLVDRIELEEQAHKALGGLFKGQYFVRKYKDGDWHKGHIVISTVQTLLFGDKYRDDFSPTDFELVISDEAHRSINGNARAVFEYFIGYKLGLTATPKDYFKGINETGLQAKNIRALEERNLRDTYRTFGCEPDEPTFRYDLKRGSEEHFLVKPFVIDARTHITTQLLSDKGYAIQVENEEGEIDETIYQARDFERDFFNDNTNRVFCEALLNNGLTDPHTGEFGKTLVFCVSQSHAAKITQILNELSSQKWKGKYNSDFAVQVTSHVRDAQKYAKEFTNNRLNGKSGFAKDSHPDYGTSKTRICVAVGMMTTGYDCPDLLNVVLLRPIFSPTDFIQMRGRGTRTHRFIYQENGVTKKKEKFLLLDYFGNCEYFEHDFDYDKKISIPQKAANYQDTEDPELSDDPIIESAIVDYSPDAIATKTILLIGKQGMRIDRELYKETYQQFEHVLNSDNVLKKLLQEQGLERVKEYIAEEIFHHPTEYWTTQKIRDSYQKKYRLDRAFTLAEMILKALGKVEHFKTREERLNEEFQKFLSIEKPSTEKAEALQTLKDFFELYLSDSAFREIMDGKDYAELNTYPSFSLGELEVLKKATPEITQYINEYLQREMKEFNWQNNAA